MDIWWSIHDPQCISYNSWGIQINSRSVQFGGQEENQNAVFPLTLLHQKILTAKSAEKVCQIFEYYVTLYQRLPSICAKIAYLHDSRQVWETLLHWRNLSGAEMQVAMRHRCRAKIVKAVRRYFDGMVIFFWWNIWNECNRRTFQQLTKEPLEVAF